MPQARSFRRAVVASLTLTLVSFPVFLESRVGLASDFRPLIQDWESASFGGDGSIEFEPIRQVEQPIQPDRQDETSPAGPADDYAATKVTDQLIRFAPGDPLTGLRWTGPLSRENYELKLKARRVEGFDFFIAVTFPVGEEHCSFVLGGWGGGILGISSINGDDAANNQTTQYKDFQNGQWYDVRIRVDTKKIQCWIDDEQWVDIERDRNGFDIRIEMDPCLPLGLANFQCTSEIKSVQLRTLGETAEPAKVIENATTQEAGL